MIGGGAYAVGHQNARIDNLEQQYPSRPPPAAVLAYLIMRGGSMHERSARHAGRQEEAYRAYIQQATSGSPGSTADQLSKLASLRDQGEISAAEFDREKSKVLA